MKKLASSFWKDSPSSYYWDVWTNKLIHTNENGIQIESFSGYGCKCQKSKENLIGIFYNARTQELSFYKNGINQGIAFTSVPSGMTPSIDIWFQYGSVEILKNRKPMSIYDC